MTSEDAVAVHPAAVHPAAADSAITPRRQKTREKLIDAAIPLLAAKGVSGTSIEDLAEAAGMTRGAFYSNFASRDELVLAVCDHAIGRAMERVNEVADVGLDQITREVGRQDKHQLIEIAVRRYFAENPETADWVLAEREIHLHAMRVPEMQGKYNELVQAHIQQFAVVIGTMLERFDGRATIPAEELVNLLSTVTQDASMQAIPGHRSGPLNIDPTATLRILHAFVEFD